MDAAAPAAIYLDHAATTPLRDEVVEAMARAQADAWANPSSPHAAGRVAPDWVFPDGPPAPRFVATTLVSSQSGRIVLPIPLPQRFPGR